MNRETGIGLLTFSFRCGGCRRAWLSKRVLAGMSDQHSFLPALSIITILYEAVENITDDIIGVRLTKEAIESESFIAHGHDILWLNQDTCR